MGANSSFLDPLLSPTHQDDGTPLPRRANINYVGFSVDDDPTTDATVITNTGGSGAIAVADIAALRAVSSLTDKEVATVASPLGTWVYSSSSGAGVADDGATVVKPNSILVGSNGRWYNVNSSSVLPTIAALRLATSGSAAAVQIQNYADVADGGGGIFDFDANDTSSTDDGGTVIVAGTRRYKRRYVGRVHAKWFGAKGDGTTNDIPVLDQMLAVALAGPGHAHISEGNFKLTTPLNIPPGVTLHLTPQTTLTSTANPGGFFGNIQHQGSQTDSGTLQADVVAGSTTIEVTGLSGAPSVGQVLGIVHADTNPVYEIMNVVHVSGSHYTLTVERPAFAAWTTGDTVGIFAAVASEFGVEGNGATLICSSSPGHAILITGAKGVHIRGLNIVASATTTAGIGLDGCQECTIEDCIVDMSATSSAAAFQFEGCERSVGKNLTAIGGSYGFNMSDSFESGFESCWAYSASGVGMIMGTLGAAGYNFGCIDCWIHGGGAIACANGLGVFGSLRGNVIGFKASHSTNDGILINVGSAFLNVPTTDNIFIGCSGTDSANAGCIVDSNTTGTKIIALDVSGSLTYGLRCNAPVDVNGVVAHRMTAGTAISVTASSRSRILGIDVKYDSGSALFAAVVDNGGLHCELGGRLDMNGTTSCLCLGGVSGQIDCTNLVGTGAAVGAQILSGCSMRLDNVCDFSGCTTAMQTIAGSKLRRAKETRVVANAVTDTAYPKEDEFQIGKIQTTLVASPAVLMTYDGPYPADGTVEVWIDVVIVDETAAVFDACTVRGIVKISAGVLTAIDTGTTVIAYNSAVVALPPVISIVSSKIVVSTAQTGNETIDWAAFIKFRTLDLS